MKVLDSEEMKAVLAVSVVALHDTLVSGTQSGHEFCSIHYTAVEGHLMKGRNLLRQQCLLVAEIFLLHTLM